MANKIKSWSESKTMRVALATFLSGIALYLTGEQTLEELLVVVLGIVFAYLRTITDSPVE